MGTGYQPSRKWKGKGDKRLTFSEQVKEFSELVDDHLRITGINPDDATSEWLTIARKVALDRLHARQNTREEMGERDGKR